jgi:hypothetical protein
MCRTPPTSHKKTHHRTALARPSPIGKDLEGLAYGSLASGGPLATALHPPHPWRGGNPFAQEHV